MPRTGGAPERTGTREPRRGAGVVINSSGAIYVAPEVDITAAVIQQLDQNQATRTATVARHAVSECQARAQAPAQ